MQKRYLFNVLVFMMTSLISVGFISCSSDDDDSNSAIIEYVGKWSCTSPNTFNPSTIVTEGTILLITSSGDMTWTMSDESKYKATMRDLGDDWADITYNGKTYRAEIYVRNNILHINVNGDANLKVKDFPFDGSYIKIN